MSHRKTRDQHEEKTQYFLDHIEELRVRLGYAMLAVTVGIVIGWFLFPAAYALITAPIISSVKAHGGSIFTMQPSEGFFTRMKLSVVLGIALASPVIIYQLWAFIRPGLLKHERRAVTPLMPVISVLFLCGMGLAYLMLPAIIRFFLNYIPHEVMPNLTYQESINLPVKTMLAFGMAFELPVILIGLVAIEMLTPQMLLRQWRYAVVVIAFIAAIVTPTADPLNWSLMMVPLLLLYFGTVLVALRIVKK